MRVLALDIGDKTIGVAASDPLGLTAQGVETIRRTSNKNDLKRLRELVAQFEAKTFVIGLPKNMDGTEGTRCEFVKTFAAKIAAALPDVEQSFWDERLSTVAAQRTLLEADLSRKKRKQVIDKMAAVYILQGWLDKNQLGI